MVRSVSGLLLWVVSCHLLNDVIVSGLEEKQFCIKSDCKDTNCPKTVCEHGSCNEQGVCICEGCWFGTSCDIQGNNHVPTFQELELHFTVADDHPITTPVGSAGAVDEDEATCTSQTECPCAAITYSLTADNSNFQDLFDIDTNGKIFARESLGGIREKTNGGLELTVSAENQATGAYGKTGSEIPVYISVVQTGQSGSAPYGGFNAKYDNNGYSQAFPSAYDDNEAHNRGKRSISTVPAGTPNVTFDFSKTGIYENETSMMVGSRVSFQLAIHFPVGVTDMLVELFTPDNDTTVMVLCDVTVTSVGTSLSRDGASLSAADLTTGITLEAKTTDSLEYDRAILNLGNITNSHSSGGLAVNTEMIILTWTVFMIDNNQTQNGSIYWVSAGAEYNSETEIWVGQASFEALTNTQTYGDPSFNYTGPTTLPIGSSAAFRVDMFIPYPSVHLVFDAFAPLNVSDVMSVCNVLVVDTGDHYKCLEKEKFTYTTYPADTGKGNGRGRIDLGTVTNAGIHEAGSTDDDNRISLEFVVLVYNDTANVGQEVWIGAAAEIGTTQIWAGQMKVTIVDNMTVPASTDRPDVLMTTKSSTNASVFDTVVYELNMTVPNNTEGLYELEVLAPYNDSATRMKICDIKLVAQGVNVPCFVETTPVYSSRDSSNVTDRAVWDLGLIQNHGGRDVTKDQFASTVTFQIVAQILNHSLNVDGERVWLTVGITIGADKLWVGQNGVLLTNESTTNTANPSYNMDYDFLTDLVPIGGSASVTIEMVTPYNSKYNPMTLELIMPYVNDSAVMKICRAEIVSNGNNLPCFDRETLNNSIAYTSKNGSMVYDKAAVDMGAVCNVKQAEDNQTAEDKVTFNLVVQLLNHITLVNGTKNWISAGMGIGTQYIWVGQLALFADTLTKASFSAGQTPYFSVNRTNTSDPNDPVLYQGRTAAHLLTMKFPNQSRSDVTITVTVGNDMHLCIIRVKEVGRNFPCLDDQLLGNYTERPGTYYVESGKLEFGPITNVGNDPFLENDEFDNNTITLEIVTTSYGTATGSRNIDVNIDYTSGTQNIPLPITLTTDVALGYTETPEFNFTVSDFNGTSTNSIAKGQAYKFYLDIFPATNSINKMQVKFLTPVNQTGVMEICSAYVVQVGKNIPCLKKQEIKPTYESRTISSEPDHSYIDFGSLDLGYVCQFPFDEVDPEANMVRVEAVAKVTRNNSLSAGDTVALSSTVKINEDVIYVTQMTLVIDDTFNATQGNLTDLTNGNLSRISVNLTSSPLEMYPGTVYDIPLVLNVPANISVLSYMDVKTPSNDTAVATIKHIEIMSAGKNLGCLTSNQDKEIEQTYNSTQGTTQKDYAIFDFGIISNSGVTYRVGTYEEIDDLLLITAQIQLADAEVNTADSEHWLSFGLSLGDTIFITYHKVIVKRTGLEMPELLLEATFNDSLTYTTGDLITIDALLKHTNMSSAEGYNVTANFYYPEFLSFVALNSTNMTQDEISSSPQGNGIQIKFSRIFFTDIVAFTFTLQINASQGVPFTNTALNATTPYLAAGNMIYRPGHANGSDTLFIARLDSLSIAIIAPGAVASCAALPLGMQDGRIQDCQIEGSDSPIPGYQPQQARVGATNDWVVGSRAGQFLRYMQVHLGNMTKVTELTVNHLATSSYSRVKSFKFYYSDDAINWEAGETIQCTTGYTTETLPLMSPVETRYIRLEVVDEQDPNTMPSVQVELRGCQSTSDRTPEQVCAARESSWEYASPSPQLYTRGFLVTATNYYYCDENPLNDNKVECFTSDSGLTSWDAMNEMVVTLLGADSSTQDLYGIAWDKRSFIISSDNGETWKSISQDQLNKVKAAGTFIYAKEVPYFKTSWFDKTSTNSNYTFNSASARYGGIWKDTSTQVTTWDTCC